MFRAKPGQEKGAPKSKEVDKLTQQVAELTKKLDDASAGLPCDACQTVSLRRRKRKQTTFTKPLAPTTSSPFKLAK